MPPWSMFSTVRSSRALAIVLTSTLSWSGLVACNDGKPKASAPSGHTGAPVTGIDSAKARELMAQGALVVDVREQGEWDEGHLPQA